MFIVIASSSIKERVLYFHSDLKKFIGRPGFSQNIHQIVGLSEDSVASMCFHFLNYLFLYFSSTAISYSLPALISSPLLKKKTLNFFRRLRASAQRLKTARDIIMCFLIIYPINSKVLSYSYLTSYYIVGPWIWLCICVHTLILIVPTVSIINP